MAYTLSTKQVIGRSNGTTPVLVPTLNAAAGVGPGNGNYFDNQGTRKFLFISNASGGVLTVTIKSADVANRDGLLMPDHTFTVADGVVNGMFGECLTALYEQLEGAVQKAILIEWSTVTSVTFAVIELPKGTEGQ